MDKIVRTAIVEQFRRPRGLAGRVAGWIMAVRPSNRARNNWLIETLSIEPQHRVLELGYGPGYAIARVASRISTGIVVGIDHSETMYRAASVRNASLIAAGKVDLILGGLDALTSLPAGFDRVFSANVLQFVPDRVAVLRHVLRLLRPGGLIATGYQPRHQRATDADALRFGEALLREMQEAGFATRPLARGPARPVLNIAAIGERACQLDPHETGSGTPPTYLT
jgi:trans-aconitate methyltransferase